MGSVSTYIDEATVQKIDELTAKSGAASRSEYLKEIIEKHIDRTEGRTKAGKEEPTRRRERYKSPSFADEIMDTYKEAIKVKTLASTLGIPLAQQQSNQPPTNWYPPWMYPPQQPQQKPQPMTTKEMMDQVTLFRMIDSMGEKAKDPETVKILTEIKEKMAQQMIEARKQPERDHTKELMDRIVIFKSLGMTDEAKNLQTQLLTIFADQRKELAGRLDATETAMSGLTQQMHEQQLGRLAKEIEDIKRRPTELDKIRELSALSQKDPAVKAYFETALGVKKKGFTPKDIGDMFKEMNINVGDFIDAMTGWLRGKPKPLKVPPPPGAPTPAPATAESALPPRLAPPRAIEELTIEGVPPAAPTEELFKMTGEPTKPAEKTPPSPPPPKTKKAPKPKRKKK